MASKHYPTRFSSPKVGANDKPSLPKNLFWEFRSTRLIGRKDIKRLSPEVLNWAQKRNLTYFMIVY